MIVKLQSLSNKEILQNNNELIKYSNTLFRAYYLLFKKEIINSIKEKREINLIKHREGFVSLLIKIYSKVLKDNKSSIFNKNLKTKSNDNIDFTKIINQNKIEVENQFRSEAEKRTDLIFNNITEKVDYLFKKSKENFNSKLKEKQSKLSLIATSIATLDMLFDTFQKKKKAELIKKQTKLQQEIVRDFKNEENIILNSFEEEFDLQVVDTKSKIHSQNEVDNFSEVVRQSEVSTLLAFSYLLNDSFKRNVFVKETIVKWKNPKDDKSRHSHASADGQERKVGELFVIANPKTGASEYTDKPRGEGLSVENSANCRCTLEYSIEITINEIEN